MPFTFLSTFHLHFSIWLSLLPLRCLIHNRYPPLSIIRTSTFLNDFHFPCYAIKNMLSPLLNDPHSTGLLLRASLLLTPRIPALVIIMNMMIVDALLMIFRMIVITIVNDDTMKITKFLMMMPFLIVMTPVASEAKARLVRGWEASLGWQKPSMRQKSVQWEDQSSEKCSKSRNIFKVKWINQSIKSPYWEFQVQPG